MQKNITKSFIFILLVGSMLASGCSKKSTDIVLSEPVVAEEGSLIDDKLPEAENEDKNSSENKEEKKESSSGDTDSDAKTQDKPVEDTAAIPETVMVHVCGAVLCEGVYELPKGSRVVDAIKAAGGFSAEADSDFVNQALVLEDGIKIRIPTGEESLALAEGTSSLQNTGALDTAGISGGALDSTSSSKEDGGKVNINTAGEDELCSIPGIGQSRAKSIIAYREENGRFGTIEDIKKVTGIKDKFFSKIKDHITV